MAEINDVYGADYQKEATMARNNHAINVIANNVAHRQFGFKLTDTHDLWDQNHNLLREVIESFLQKVHQINPQMHPQYIEKTSSQINMLPELIIDTPVEYFWMIDGDYHRAYFFYITPYEVGAY
uniref:Uncharacterized protein n=1 Tax=viral metagenome TaxID=1070528 RepID=A0A6C0BJF4_9ZZZZ